MTPQSADAFEVLGRTTSGRGNLRIREADLVLAGGHVAHAIDFDGRPLLLIPLLDDQQGAEDDQSRGVSLHTRPLIDNDVSRRYLAMRCEIPALTTTFASLCDDLIEALKVEPDRPAARSLAILDKWRDLLGPSAAHLLSEGRLLGLLAELHFLEQLVQVAGTETALTAWTGPGSERQDFMTTKIAVEVKGSALRDRIVVEIHGLRQLEEPAGGRLFLWVEHFERATDGGDSVPDAIERLSAAGVSRLRILTALQPSGYRPADEHAYLSVRFRLLDRRAYEVDSSFPRLVPGSLAEPASVDRLLSVRYTLDLTDRQAEPRPLEFPSDVITLLAAIE